MNRTSPSGTWLRIGEHRTREGGTVTTWTDITTLKHHEAELADLVRRLEVARDEAMEASRTNELPREHEPRAAHAAQRHHRLTEHDARTPRASAPRRPLEPLRRVHRAPGTHLLKLINDVLDLSKIEAGKLELDPRDLRASRPVVEEVIGTARPLAEQNKNALELDCAAGLGAVHADAMRLRQILLNLLSNACKFTEDGTVTLEVAARRRRRAGWIDFAVSDTGIGMTDGAARRGCSRSSRRPTPRPRANYGGTGLGLAISRKLCQLMGGDITVTSAPGKGSTFTRPPAGATAAPPISTVAHALSRRPVAAAPKGARGAVLVIDDDQTARELMAAHLVERLHGGDRELGHRGLEKAREFRPAAITLDIMMPDIDGWTVIAAIKAIPDLADIPVIIITIVDEPRRGITLGAAGYLTKPIDRDRLLEVLAGFRVPRKPGTILIVEDDEGQRQRVALSSSAGLDGEGSGQRQARPGRAGRWLPDIVLLDLMMPEMDGFQVVAALQENPAWRYIPVVVVTALELTAEDRKRLNRGVEHIVLQERLDAGGLMARIGALVKEIKSKAKPKQDA